MTEFSPEWHVANQMKAFVWGHDLADEIRILVFSDESRALYEKAEEGIRVNHVAFLGELLKRKSSPIQEKDEQDRSLQEIAELTVLERQIMDIGNYLQKMTGGLIANDVATVVSIEPQRPDMQPAQAEYSAVEQAS